MNFSDAPVESISKEIQADGVLFATISRIRISAPSLETGSDGTWFPSSILAGQSCEVVSTSISSAIIFGTSRRSRDFSSGDCSSCLLSRYSKSVRTQASKGFQRECPLESATG